MLADVMTNTIQPVSKAEAAYASLRHSIRIGDLAPGQRVTLKQLSEVLSMSLTPVREALGRLVSEGYAVHDLHRGTFIAQQTPERVEQIYRLRAVLEPMAAGLAAERADDQAAARLQQALSDLEQAGTREGRAEANERFHFELYRMADDALLVSFIEQLWAGMPYPVQRIYLDDSDGASSAAEHRLIADAVIAGDAAGAVSAMKGHIARGRRVALDHALR